MRGILSLPVPLLLLISAIPWSTAAEAQWPSNLPPDARYFPEDEIRVKKGLDALKKLASQTPIGAQKMSGDPNEMFFLEYWQFEDPKDNAASPVTPNDRLLRRAFPTEYANLTVGSTLLPPFLPHSDRQNSRNWQDLFGFYARSNLLPRDFSCPANTKDCGSISRPYSCCGTSETCVIVDNLDAGMGDVGCCPAGANCGGQVSSCNSNEGYKSCPASPNGGCCIPNYECQGVGCVSGTTSTTTTTLPVATVTTCATGWHSCASSLGGGCCQNGADCATSKSCRLSSTPSQTTTTTTASPTVTTAAGAPLRPTGSTSTNSDSAIAPSTLTTGTSLIAVCPTNYYFCSAYYRPGCCQVGLDCALSNCPAASSSTLVSNGVTIIVPAGSTTGGTSYVTTALITGTASAFRSGSCAGGWQSCGADVGGGCCPPNFACGNSCTGTAGGATGVVSKLAPSGGRSTRVGAGAEILGLLWGSVCVGLGIGMVLL